MKTKSVSQKIKFRNAVDLLTTPYGVIRRRPIEIPAMLLGEGARKAEKQQNEQTDSAAHSCCGCSDRRLSVLAVIYMALFVTSTFAQMARLRIFAPGALLAVVCRGARSSQGMKENQRYLTCSELRTGRLGPIRQDPDRSRGRPPRCEASTSLWLLGLAATLFTLVSQRCGVGFAEDEIPKHCGIGNFGENIERLGLHIVSPDSSPRGALHCLCHGTLLADKSAVDKALQQVQGILNNRPSEVREKPLVDLPKN